MSDRIGIRERLGWPDVGGHRRFVTAIAIDAVGSGVFMPVSVLYFLATTDLDLVAVGAALSLAALVALPTGPLLGGVVDRVGAKQVLLLGNALQALGFLAYLVADSFAAVVVWTMVVTAGRTAFWGSYGALVTVISRPGERELWFGFLGALRNVGFALGGLAAGLAITVGTGAAYSAVVLVNAVSFAVAFVLLLGVPAPPARALSAEPGSWRPVLRDGPFRLLLGVQLGYCLAMMLLNIALPVYATEVLGLPGWVTGAVFTLNTVMVGFGQGLVVRAMTGARRWRVMLLAQLAFVASYVVLVVAGALPVGLAVAVLLLGSVVYTLGELLGGPVLGATTAEHAPDRLRGRYLSLVQVAWNAAGVVAPVAFAVLLDAGTWPLFAVLGVVGLAASIGAVRVGAVMPTAADRVTNAAAPEETGEEPGQAPGVEPAAVV